MTVIYYYNKLKQLLIDLNYYDQILKCSIKEYTNILNKKEQRLFDYNLRAENNNKFIFDVKFYLDNTIYRYYIELNHFFNKVNNKENIILASKLLMREILKLSYNTVLKNYNN